ncbi:MAG: C-GCAxxG-C-C family protein, partial [Paludibacteraceae bacterium]|nr:C-GCAxxG-C-C family protein [Paludibacteraceae bacterium]
AADFKALHGSLTCSDLLGLSAQRSDSVSDPTPSPRTNEYYHKRPCVEMVGNAVRIFLKHGKTLE